MNKAKTQINSKSRMVRMSIADLKPRTKEDAQRLYEASNASDEELTRRAESDPDNQPITDEDFKSGALKIIHRPSKPKKVLLSIRLDEDLIEWFKSQGESGYQTRINDALRTYKAQVGTGNDSPAEALEKIESLLQDVRRRVA